MFHIDRRLFLQMTLIMAASMVMGIAWNHGLLKDIMTGKGLVTGQSPLKPSELPLPLPLGLMQVKDFFDGRDAVFVDARDAATYRLGHIADSVSLPVAALQGGRAPIIPGIGFSTPLVVYCNGFACHDSKTVATGLISAGYQSVYIFEGGYPEWQSAGYPLAGSRP